MKCDNDNNSNNDNGHGHLASRCQSSWGTTSQRWDWARLRRGGAGQWSGHPSGLRSGWDHWHLYWGVGDARIRANRASLNMPSIRVSERTSYVSFYHWTSTIDTLITTLSLDRTRFPHQLLLWLFLFWKWKYYLSTVPPRNKGRVQKNGNSKWHLPWRGGLACH